MDLKNLINKQFELEGFDYDFSRLSSSGLVKWMEKNKEKSKEWYLVYQFSSKEKYEEWKELCLKEMTPEEFITFDFKYGMTYKY